MKLLLLTAYLVLFSIGAKAQIENPNYDPDLAKSLNGNDQGMKKYVLAILKTGSYTPTDKTILDSLFSGHMKNIKRLADNGSLIVAGPLGKNDQTYRGIFILNVETLEEAKSLVATDPAVKANLFDVEVFTFWSTAALQEIPKIHNKIIKFN